MTNTIILDEVEEQFLYFTYTERQVYDKIDMDLIEISTGKEYTFILDNDSSWMVDRFNKHMWSNLVDLNVSLPIGNYIYFINNFKTDVVDDEEVKVDNKIIETGTISIQQSQSVNIYTDKPEYSVFE